MRNNYDKTYDGNDSVDGRKAFADSFKSTEVVKTEQEVIPTNTDLFSNEYKGSWRATQGVNLRSKPDMTGSILTVVQSGDKIDCDGYYANERKGKEEIIWLKVNYKGHTGYTMKAFYSRR